jgi:hypothetical protein
VILLATLTIALLFRHRALSRENLVLAALIASVCWLSIFAAPFSHQQPSSILSLRQTTPNVGGLVCSSECFWWPSLSAF